MLLAEAAKPMQRKNWKPLGWLVMSLGVLGATLPARSECQSPSAEAGTTTTVYRCPDEGAAAGPLPVIADPGKTTEVERGSAGVPWFEPKTTKTADPIQPPKAASEPKATSEPKAQEEIVRIEPVPAAAPPATKEALAEETTAGAGAAEAKAAPAAAEAETTAAAPATPEVKAAAKVKQAKAKKTKVKLVKSQRAKSKLAQEKRIKGRAAKTEAIAAKTVKTETKAAKAVKAEPRPEQIKTEPAKSDDKVIVMTKEDLPLGSRVKNWFGF